MAKKLNHVAWLKYDNGRVQANHYENFAKVKDLLEDTGKGFCLAKFTQVTMHLGTGLTHSCHHPVPHRIPIEEVTKNPAALFNTSYLKQARKEMMSNERPKECDYCWRIEDSGGNSDRFLKSLEPWALENHDRIVDSDPSKDYYPTYLEVDFSNVCNFKCTYCGPEYSTTWAEDIKKKGPIILLDKTNQVQWAQGWQKNLDNLVYKNREFNPYLDAFWKWWPDVYKHLKVYRITGGEPLMSKETFRSIDWFIDNPNQELEFSINTNLGTVDKLWDKFIKKVKILTEKRSVKRFTVFTSVDAWGKRAEYIRTGLNFELFKKRYEQLLEIPNVRVTIMCTFNIMSVTSIKELLEWQLKLKKKYNNSNMSASWEDLHDIVINEEGLSYSERRNRNPDHESVVGIDIPYLRQPWFLDSQYITKDLVQEYLIPAINFMSRNTAQHIWNSHQGFEDYELEKFKRIVIQILTKIKSNETEVSPDTVINRAKFYDFIMSIDQRNGTNFLEVFPEMKQFFELCKESKNSHFIIKDKS
jgi:organic radical activating enzyme